MATNFDYCREHEHIKSCEEQSIRLPLNGSVLFQVRFQFTRLERSDRSNCSNGKQNVQC